MPDLVIAAIRAQLSQKDEAPSPPAVAVMVEALRCAPVPALLLVIQQGDGKKGATALQGMTRTLVSNMVEGVTKGFERALEIVGVGYRVELKSDVLTFALGYSHPVVYKLPSGIAASVDKNKVVLSGIDKELLGATAAKIRSFRKPEPYKGKGIKFAEEQIRRKVGKTGAK